MALLDDITVALKVATLTLIDWKTHDPVASMMVEWLLGDRRVENYL
jgi:hypothetical protein